jgi:hypothetical protein
MYAGRPAGLRKFTTDGCSRISLFAVGLFISTTAGCGVITIPVPRDFSGFEEFHFEMTSGLGFCPPENRVVKGTIRTESAGVYSIELTINEGIVDGEYVFREDPTRMLSDDEREQMLGLFRRVVFRYSISGPLCFGYDVCVINRYQWDDSVIVPIPCIQPYIDEDYAGRVNEFLESLRTDVD